MNDSDYRYGYAQGPYYRKFMVGDIGVEVNRDGNGEVPLEDLEARLGSANLSKVGTEPG